MLECTLFLTFGTKNDNSSKQIQVAMLSILKREHIDELIVLNASNEISGRMLELIV